MLLGYYKTRNMVHSRNLQFVNALNVIIDIDDANCSFYGAIYYKKLQSLSPTDTFTLSL